MNHIFSIYYSSVRVDSSVYKCDSMKEPAFSLTLPIKFSPFILFTKLMVSIYNILHIHHSHEGKRNKNNIKSNYVVQ